MRKQKSSLAVAKDKESTKPQVILIDCGESCSAVNTANLLAQIKDANKLTDKAILILDAARLSDLDCSFTQLCLSAQQSTQSPQDGLEVRGLSSNLVEQLQRAGLALA